ncbi:DUF5689 domain-containing protein [uncultured Mucilaginibacter sp.]|uniref:DUF5689 domain-containing protein n=1 Tax=uncultured Mucilaginibacter sp. TaxID=797541 RepID=UPI0025FE6D1D|nr:DUF5689 domain-containing protein [uncultured Mucilaginibacter sp.]
MKKIHLFMIVIAAAVFAGCKKDNYPGGVPGPTIAVLDLRAVYKGSDVILNEENLGGAKQFVGVVISEPAQGNQPSGKVVIQNYGRNKLLRGISVVMGAAATNYQAGDSVQVVVTGATLTRVNGTLSVTNVPEANVTKLGRVNSYNVRAANTAAIAAAPDSYESTLISISNAITEPEPVAGDTYAGDKVINDGFAKMTLHTEANATFATTQLPANANFIGIAVTGTDGKIQLWPRRINEIRPLPLIRPSAVIITGYLTNPTGADNNYEYIQLKATRDIDFAVTNFSLVTCNNAGSGPVPVNGWAIGGTRSYKFNLTSGTVKKGQYFYVGGNKNIFGANSTDMSSSVWANSTLYSNVNGADFGTATTNLLANSGNIAGIAVFQGTTVDGSTVPLDVIMYGGAGNFYSAGPPEIGYRVTNTDYYGTINPISGALQNFYGSGTNTQKLGLPANENFVQLGGVYDAVSGRWTTPRTLTSIPLTPTSPVTTLEVGDTFTKIVN